MQLTALRNQSYASRYLVLVGGEIISKLCVTAAFGYLARVLTAADYGTVELAFSITVFFVLGVESGMGLYGARVVATAPERIPTLVAHVMVLRVLLGLPAFAIVLAVAAHYRFAGLGLLAVNGLAILLTPLLTQWVFQGLRQMQWVAAGSMLRNIVFVACVLLLVRPGADIRLVSAAEVIGIAVLASFNSLILSQRLQVRLEWRGAFAGARALFRDVWFMGLSDFTWACLWYAPALIIGWLGRGMEQVAWVAKRLRVVMALHTFVFLYLFNMLPNMARALVESREEWRRMAGRSLSTSLWPACLIALGGTLIAPLLMPLIFGHAYAAAVVPFRIIIWMIPVAWFSGNFRFSLIAAGHQRWEFAASAGAAIVTVIVATTSGHYFGSVGAASALLVGGIVNAALAILAANRCIGVVPLLPRVGPPLVATVAGLVVGVALSMATGVFPGAVLGCLVFVAIAARQDDELVALVRAFVIR